MRVLGIVVVLTSCVVERGGPTPEGLACMDASDCSRGEFCALAGGLGTCRSLPRACGIPADCGDPACAAALESTCPSGQRAVRCANPIDPSSEIVGNPAFTCG